MGRHALSTDKDWFAKQDEVIVIGISEGVVDIKTPISMDETFDVISVAYDMLLAALYEEKEGQSLQ